MDANGKPTFSSKMPGYNLVVMFVVQIQVGYSIPHWFKVLKDAYMGLRLAIKGSRLAV